MTYNAIPAMTDPLGRYWKQPDDIRLAPMDATHVLLSTAQVAQLKNYFPTYPSGMYDGKCWKRGDGKEYYLCWYEPHVDPSKIAIGSRLILEVE